MFVIVISNDRLVGADLRVGPVAGFRIEYGNGVVVRVVSNAGGCVTRILTTMVSHIRRRLPAYAYAVEGVPYTGST